MLFVDHHGFEAVEDTLGHAAGDQLLVSVAGRLSQGRADRGPGGACGPVALEGRAVTVTAGMGGTLAVPGDTCETLLHRADTAMYAAERDGKDSVELSTRPDAPPRCEPSGPSHHR